MEGISSSLHFLQNLRGGVFGRTMVMALGVLNMVHQLFGGKESGGSNLGINYMTLLALIAWVSIGLVRCEKWCQNVKTGRLVFSPRRNLLPSGCDPGRGWTNFKYRREPASF